MARQRQRKGDPVHGWLNLFKPVDMTSTQAVGAVKRLFSAQKAGHAGTLDPLADGVLPIALGEATKTVAHAMDADKEYVFTIAWGASTSTQDREGEIVARSDLRPQRGDILAALPAFVGDIQQVPPKFSAIKVDGERAYDLARDGEAFELEARPVRVHDVALLDLPDPDHAVIRVACGKGFYIRALVRDLARSLGAEGHVSQLRRTRVGRFRAETAFSLEKLEALAHKGELLASLLPIETALDDIPVLAVGGEDAFRLRQGREIVLLPHFVEAWRMKRASLAEAGGEASRIALAKHGEQAVALGEVRAGRFQPVRVFQS